jgi:hypothetical protein
MNVCDDTCGSEGFYDEARSALLCDGCGKADLSLALTRLSKSLIRRDSDAEVRRLARLVCGTWAVAVEATWQVPS